MWLKSGTASSLPWNVSPSAFGALRPDLEAGDGQLLALGLYRGHNAHAGQSSSNDASVDVEELD
jgi:hypothetical protein